MKAVIKINHHLICVFKFNKVNPYRTFCQKKNKFGDEEELSMEEKYKDFSVESMKKFQAMKRKEDYLSFDLFNKNPFKSREKSLQTNFLQQKTHDTIAIQEKINLDQFSNSKEDVITLYEIDIGTIKSMKLYSFYFKCLLSMWGITLSLTYFKFAYLFQATLGTYIFNYATSCLLFANFLVLKRIKSTHVLEMTLDNRSKEIEIKFLKFWNFKHTYSRRFKISDLELYENETFPIYGHGLRVKESTNDFLYLAQTGIWYHRLLFDELFKR